MILFFLLPLTTSSSLYTTFNPPLVHPRGRHLTECAEYAKTSIGDLSIDVDDQRQYFALSQLQTVTDTKRMARYFTSSFFINRWDSLAETKLQHELYSRSSVSDPPHRWSSSSSYTSTCNIQRDPSTPNNSRKKKLTLIYQMNYSSPFNHREWIDEILGGPNISIDHQIIWDGRFQVLKDHAIIIYHTKSCEKSNKPLLNYLKQYDRLHLAYGLIHLHDERIDGCRSHYPMARFVLRNNMHPSMYHNKHILEIPIGYSNGAGRKPMTTLTPLQDRDYVWSFMGDIESKPHRKTTIFAMQSLSDRLNLTHAQYHLTTTNIWNDIKQLSVETYRHILSNSIFAPSPIGTVYNDGNLPNGLGAMRTWECLENGCLPIIENFELHDPKWKEHTNWLYVGRYGVEKEIPLLIVNQNWSNINEVLEPYLNNPKKLQKLQTETMEWYNKIKNHTRNAVLNFVMKRLYENRQWYSAKETGHCTIYLDDAYYTMKCNAL